MALPHLDGCPFDGKTAEAFAYDARHGKLPDQSELHGKNLACWCPIGQFCHADVLLELANREEAPKA